MSTATQPDVQSPPPPPPSAPARAARAPRSKRRIVLPVVALLGVLALVWAYRQWSYGRTHESTDNAQVDGHIIPVIAKVGGYVREVAAGENEPVRAGQTLVTIDDAEYAVRLAQAEADLAAAEAAAGGRGSTGQAEAAVTSASRQRGVADAQIAAARANAERARADLARIRELADKQIVSRQQLDAAEAAAAAEAATLLAVERQAGAAGAGVMNAEAGVRLAAARLAAARAARDNARLQLSYTKIAAPLAGTVARKQVEVGQLVQPGQTLLSIVADTGIWVTANMKETQLAGVAPGRPAALEVDAYDGCTARGVVESVSGATGARFALLPPDNATGNFTKVVQRVPVRIRVTRGCGDGRPLRPGMSVVASVEVGETRPAASAANR
jgi:membrane fusion protein, multidrug efflux system